MKIPYLTLKVIKWIILMSLVEKSRTIQKGKISNVFQWVGIYQSIHSRHSTQPYYLFGVLASLVHTHICEHLAIMMGGKHCGGALALDLSSNTTSVTSCVS